MRNIDMIPSLLECLLSNATNCSDDIYFGLRPDRGKCFFACVVQHRMITPWCGEAWRAGNSKQFKPRRQLQATLVLRSRGAVHVLCFRRQRYQQHCMRPCSEKNKTSVGRVRNRCRRRWRAAPRSNAHEHRSLVEVRDDVVAERALGCREVHKETPSTDRQGPSVERRHAQHFSHVLQPRVRRIHLAGPKPCWPNHCN